jgi:hypothetical protein
VRSPWSCDLATARCGANGQALHAFEARVRLNIEVNRKERGNRAPIFAIKDSECGRSVARRSHGVAIAATDATPAPRLIQLRSAIDRTRKYLLADFGAGCIPTKVSMSPTPSQRGSRIVSMNVYFRSYASSRNQSRGRRKSEYKRASGVPASGCQLYSQRTSGGSDIRIDSVRPPDCRPNEVPRSYTRLNST